MLLAVEKLGDLVEHERLAAVALDLAAKPNQLDEAVRACASSILESAATSRAKTHSSSGGRRRRQSVGTAICGRPRIEPKA
jgi:hypothetical protein